MEEKGYKKTRRRRRRKKKKKKKTKMMMMRTTFLILENLNVTIKIGIFLKVIPCSPHIGPKFRKKLMASSTGRNSVMFL
jgi:accessory gene regulator protein AgrB